ncbi:hypothetical protein BT63DRAFT_166430 [Microthyrium microscopicum]|uniref:Uncharacterized protein n=1 Tax=Microthyrium microscopicum TaxID=703497 RepID=A0A6A6UQQ9_9PEZI|nr:hypothetical protein BT63DRAFT_166430 [Microthyrium microscopicum]
MSQSLSTGTIATLSVTAAVILGAFCALGYLLVRLITNHRHLLRDLESQGISLTNGFVEDNKTRSGRPRVLRKYQVGKLGKTDWTQISSTDSIANPTMSMGTINPTIHTWPKRPGSLTTARKTMANNQSSSGIVASRHLSAVLESPSGIMGLSSSPSPPSSIRESYQLANYNKDTNTHSFHSNELPKFPLDIFQTTENSLCPRPLFSSVGGIPNPSPLVVRKNRAQTVAGASASLEKNTRSRDSIRPLLHSRSISLGSQNPGNAPEDPVPPLPLAVKRISAAPRPKSWALPTSSSRQSVSSIDSVGSSVLIGSPRVTRSASLRLRNGANREYKNSLILSSRPLRKTKSLHNHSISWTDHKSLSSMPSIHSFEGRYSFIGVPESSDTSNEQHQSSHSQQRNSQQRWPKSVLDRREETWSTPQGSPKKRPASYMSNDSSPKQYPSGSGRRSPDSHRLSSTRSSNGNPFQWDPSPRPSKPSAIKGSPNSRRGHRRQNCVRISVPPTIINRARSPTPSMADILEEDSQSTTIMSKRSSTGVSRLRPRSLPRPPSISTFAPEISTRPTSLRASLTSSSGDIGLVNYLQDLSSRELGLAPEPATSYVSNSTSSPGLESLGVSISTFTLQSAGTAFSFTAPVTDTSDRTSIPPEFQILARPISPRKQTVRTADNAGAKDSKATEQAKDEQVDVTLRTLQTGEMILDFSDCQRAPSNALKASNPGQSHSSSRQGESPATLYPPTRSQSSDPHVFNNRAENHRSSDQMAPSTPANEFSLASGVKEILAQEPSPVRDSVALLRRMNSSARRDSQRPELQAARRYLHMTDRNGSPVPMNSNRCESWDSLTSAHIFGGTMDYQSEIDLMLADNRDMTDLEMHSSLGGDFLQGVKELDETTGDLSDLKTTGNGLDGKVHSSSINTQSTAKKPSDFSVWEDGEGFWGFTDEAKRLTPVKAKLVEPGNSKASKALTPMTVKVIPPSTQATPASLYDENGFYMGG